MHWTSNISQGVNNIDVKIVPTIKSWQNRLNDKHLRTRDLLFSSYSKLFLSLWSLSKRDSESTFGEVSWSLTDFFFCFFFSFAFETGVKSSICVSIIFDEVGTKVPVRVNFLDSYDVTKVYLIISSLSYYGFSSCSWKTKEPELLTRAAKFSCCKRLTYFMGAVGLRFSSILSADSICFVTFLLKHISWFINSSWSSSAALIYCSEFNDDMSPGDDSIICLPPLYAVW